MRLRLAAAAAFAAAAFLAQPAFSQTAAANAAIEEFKRGQASADAKKNSETITIMTGVIDKGDLPAEWQPFAYFFRGQAFRRENQFNKAYADFEKALSLNPTLAPVHFETGLAYAEQKNWKRSIDAYDKAVGLVPDNADYLYSRCVAKSWNNDNAGAREDCRKAVKIKPDFTDAWLTLGRAHEDMKAWGPAEEAYRKVLELDPGNAAAKEGIAFIDESRRAEAANAEAAKKKNR